MKAPVGRSPGIVRTTNQCRPSVIRSFAKQVAKCTAGLYAGPHMQPDEKMQQALALLWKQHRPDIVQRVEALACAAQALGAGSFTNEQRSDSHHIAHGLAGVLGTFGRGEGTAIARRLELLFEGESTLQPHLEEINKAVADLRRIVLELS